MTTLAIGPTTQPRLRVYSELAKWWPLFSPPSHYVEEAASLLPHLGADASADRTLLELGSGGGSMAYHFKRHFRMTLSDVSPEMLAVSAAVNPECEHVQGDMRTLRLGRRFDVVFIHDAISYLADRDSVRAALATAALHCRPGGTLLVAPDHTRENFEPSTDHGGEDGPDGSGLRYLMWTLDPDPADETYEAAFSFLLRDADGTVTVDGERHLEGLFPRAAWLEWLREAGFDAKIVEDEWNRDLFVCVRTGAATGGA